VNWVVDIGEASDVLGRVLKGYNFKNLDEVFPDENTTTEFMCKVRRAAFLFRLGVIYRWRRVRARAALWCCCWIVVVRVFDTQTKPNR
jgi:hypothetical protein